MLELRLTDPNGYTVPGAVHTVPDTQADMVRTYLLTEVAVQDADYWTGLGFPQDARDYRVQATAVTIPVVTPITQLDTAA